MQTWRVEFGWERRGDVCERYRRTRKEKREQNEWMLTRTLTSIFFFFSFSLSCALSIFPLPVCIGNERAYLSVSFSSCTCCVRRNDVGKKKAPPQDAFLFIFLPVVRTSIGRGKKLLFFIMRAMKDDVRYLT